MKKLNRDQLTGVYRSLMQEECSRFRGFEHIYLRYSLLLAKLEDLGCIIDGDEVIPTMASAGSWDDIQKILEAKSKLDQDIKERMEYHEGIKKKMAEVARLIDEQEKEAKQNMEFMVEGNLETRRALGRHNAKRPMLREIHTPSETRNPLGGRIARVFKSLIATR